MIDVENCTVIKDPFKQLRRKLISCHTTSPEDESFETVPAMPRRSNGKAMFFSRHGESEFNTEDKIGGDSALSFRGSRYAKALGQYFDSLGKVNVLV